MSVSVQLADLEWRMLGRPFAYVISTCDDQVHVIAVRVEFSEGRLDCSRVGNTTRRNIAGNPHLTVVFPPGQDNDDEYGRYSLVIDGSAHQFGDRVHVEVRSAVLHRPA